MVARCLTALVAVAAAVPIVGGALILTVAVQGADPAVAAPAAPFPYQRLDISVPREARFAVSDKVVYYPKGRALVGDALTGGKDRTYRLPKDTQAVDFFEVNDHALLASAAGPEYRVNLGKRSGPLRTLKHRVTTARLSGNRLVLLQGARDREWIRVRDLRTGKTKRLARPGFDLRYLLAAGNFVSIEREDGRVVVLDLRTGERVYSLRSTHGGAYRLMEDGDRRGRRRVRARPDRHAHAAEAAHDRPRLRGAVHAHDGG